MSCKTPNFELDLRFDLLDLCGALRFDLLDLECDARLDLDFGLIVLDLDFGLIVLDLDFGLIVLDLDFGAIYNLINLYFNSHTSLETMVEGKVGNRVNGFLAI